MKHYMKAVFSLAALALLATASVQAESKEKMIIDLKTCFCAGRKQRKNDYRSKNR